MSGFLYAIPGGGMVNAKRIEAAGLMGIFSERLQDYSQRGAGDRTLLCLGGDASRLSYEPKEQAWQKARNGKYEIGIINADRPTEEQLRRKRQLAGHYVELGDGGKWLVPVARIITGGSMLPATLILGSNGEVVTKEMPQYAQFSAKAEKLWEDFQIENKLIEGELKTTIAERMLIAAEALAWNYHLGMDEVNMMGLLTTENLSKVLRAIIDVPTLEEVIKETKKKTAAPIEGG